jgi:hypothetical protein
METGEGRMNLPDLTFMPGPKVPYFVDSRAAINLEVFLSEPVEKMPLYVNHTNDLVRVLAAWRLEKGI